MERFEDRSIGGSIKHHIEKHAAPHSERLWRSDGEYEEISFLYEPMKAYQDDLVQIEVALESKRARLKELESKAASHAVVPAEGALRILRGDLHDKIAVLREEIGRWEVLHTVTQQRLMMLARQDRNERQMLERAATETEQ